MKKIKRVLLKRNVIIAVSVVIALSVFSIFFFKSDILAEQSGQSPDSGAGVTSRIKTLSDELITLGFGTTTDTPDWGALWNRIKTAAKWVPSGNAAANDVRSGKTYNGNSRTQATGTYPAPGPCSTQQYHDSYGGSVTQTTNCTDTVTWGVASPSVAGDDTGTNIKNQDPRTGLIWSQYLKNNSGTVAFAASGGSDWSWDGTTNANSVAVGNKTAKQLCSERGNGWRLPTQKELMQAYIDGSNFNLSNPGNYFWSATEYSGTNAWGVVLDNGLTYYSSKSTSSYYVRCVR
ncbi:MAG: DUF1566 domain-containing protein [Patescibacteria group bacterium]|nr:DUF1566 domain-containing protein [Patescibacteria group bacterium]